MITVISHTAVFRDVIHRNEFFNIVTTTGGAVAVVTVHKINGIFTANYTSNRQAAGSNVASGESAVMHYNVDTCNAAVFLISAFRATLDASIGAVCSLAL